MKAAGSPSSGQTMRPQKPVSPVQAGQTALTPKEAVVADIMADELQWDLPPRRAARPQPRPLAEAVAV